MTSTAEPARAETRRTATDTPPIPLVGVAEFAGYGPDTIGAVRTAGCYVGRAMPTAEVRRLEAELKDATDTGRELVRSDVAAAVGGNPAVVAAKVRESRLQDSLAKYRADLQSAERDLAAVEKATVDAIRSGDDPTPHEQRSIALGEQVHQLRRRVAGTQEGMAETHADIVRATAVVGRATRARLQKQAEQQLDELSATVANLLFSNLIEITRTRAAIAASRDG